MTKKMAEYGHFEKRKITQEKLKKIHETPDENYNLELKKKVQEIFHNGGLEISLDEIFSN